MNENQWLWKELNSWPICYPLGLRSLNHLFAQLTPTNKPPPAHISFVSKRFPLKASKIKRRCFVRAFVDLSWLCLCVCASSLSSRATECFPALISLLQTAPRSLDPARRPRGDRNAKPKQCSSHPVSGPCLFVNKHLRSFTPHHSKLAQNISSSRCQAV